MTYNPKLASKKRYEINRQVEKAKNYVTAKQKDLNMEIWENTLILLIEKWRKAKATINEDIIKKELELAGYNLLITSETDNEINRHL